MPGRIVMESHASSYTNRPKTDPAAMDATTPARADGVMNGHSNGTIKRQDQAPALPPELEHWAHTYIPMGKLLERMAQQCYFDLGEVVDQMADLDISSPQTNGASTSAPDVSKASVDKKLRLMNFAQTQKDRFIKALVLSDWARNMGDMNKLIELRMWLTRQDDASSLVTDAIMQLKHNMIAAKMPNPNILGALELLSTAKASWVPDLGYIPPIPLSAQKLLKTLRDMNFVLSVRLNLHEQLPYHFCNYSIANGRATFVVPHEFELDLAVTDEDPTSPFYFIDIRFLFSDAPPLPYGYARLNLEGKVNEILQLSGLSAAYDFLHGFVLTHKITLLRRQAFELARTRWTECLLVEPIHRSLVVQYWTGQPGGKNWIEVGIAKANNPQNPSDAVRLNIRWFKTGKEVLDASFNIDPANPSMEHLLNQVAAAHTNQRLADIRDQLLAISPSCSTLHMNMHVSTTSPNACSLTIRLGQHGVETILRIVPVTGNISISPVTATSTDVERRLNADPSMDAAQIVSYLNCKLVQDKIVRQALQVGWLLMPTDKQPDTNKVFGEPVVRRTTFTRRGWGEDWAIAVTISLSGLRWWIVRLSKTQTGRAIQTAEVLSIPSPSKTFNRHTLMSIESRAVAQVSLSNIATQLRTAKIQHEIRHVSLSKSHIQKSSSLAAATATAIIGIKFQDLIQPKEPQHREIWKPWCHDTTVLTHHGVDESSREDSKLVHVLKATLDPKTAEDLACCVGKGTAAQDIVFAPNGVLALQFRTHFGVGLVPLIQSKLLRVERLSSCLAAIKKRNFTVDRVGVSGLVFRYQQSPPLQVGILFSETVATPLQIRFPPENTNNPHRRIKPLLQSLLENIPNQPSSVLEDTRKFSTMLNLLSATLPLLKACLDIESKDPTGKSAKTAVRSILHYRLSYYPPFPLITLDLQLERKESRNFWTVTPVKDGWADVQQKQKCLDLLQAVWRDKEISGVKGFTSGVVCEVDGLEKFLMNLDAMVRQGKEDGHEVVVLD